MSTTRLLSGTRGAAEPEQPLTPAQEEALKRERMTPAEKLLERKPKRIVPVRASFWGLQEVPIFDSTGVRCIESVMGPAGKIVAALTKMNNAVRVIA